MLISWVGKDIPTQLRYFERTTQAVVGSLRQAICIASRRNNTALCILPLFTVVIRFTRYPIDAYVHCQALALVLHNMRILAVGIIHASWIGETK